MMEHFLPARKSARAGSDRSSPWEKTHGESFTGKPMPIGAEAICNPAETKKDGTTKM